jgi:hypothetical protein
MGFSRGQQHGDRSIIKNKAAPDGDFSLQSHVRWNNSRQIWNILASFYDQNWKSGAAFWFRVRLMRYLRE